MELERRRRRRGGRREAHPRHGADRAMWALRGCCVGAGNVCVPYISFKFEEHDVKPLEFYSESEPAEQVCRGCISQGKGKRWQKGTLLCFKCQHGYTYARLCQNCGETARRSASMAVLPEGTKVEVDGHGDAVITKTLHSTTVWLGLSDVPRRTYGRLRVRYESGRCYTICPSQILHVNSTSLVSSEPWPPRSVCVVLPSGLETQVSVMGSESVEVLKKHVREQWASTREPNFDVLLTVLAADGDDLLQDDTAIADLPDGLVQAVFVNNPSATLLAPAMLGEPKFTGQPCLAQDGRIYCAPDQCGQVLCVDPHNNTASLIGLVTETDNGYVFDGLEALNGRVYFAPYDAPKVLCIDTHEDPSSEFRVSLIGPSMEAMEKYWNRGILDEAGRIFVPPSGAKQVLCIDSTTNDVSLIGPVLPDTRSKFSAPIRSTNGLIFCAPRGATNALCIDPALMSVELIGPEFGFELAYGPGVVADNGHVYFAPLDAPRVMHIDPSTRLVDLAGPEMQGGNKFSAAGVKMHNGYILFAPCDFDHVLCISPVEQEIRLIDLGLTGLPDKFNGSGVLHSCGFAFWAPASCSHVLSVGVDGDKVSVQLIHVGENNEGYYATATALNGWIYFAPDSQDRQ